MESLPNELLFTIIAHLSSLDLVRAFYGLNHRFNLIVCELARHFTIYKDTSEIEFDNYKPHIRNVVEKFCFDAQLLPQIFQSTYSYSNLRSVVLRYADFIAVDMNVNCDSAKSTIHSCLDVLRICNILPVDWNNDHTFDDDQYCSRPEEDVQLRTAIVRLSINSCSEQALLSLCALTPNLTYLKIKQLVSGDDGSNFNSILPMISQSTSLKQLHITSTTNRLNDLHLIERLIDFYHSSLEYLTLEISLNNQPDGYYLQKILEPCRYLQKLAFAFNYWHEEPAEIAALHEFQSGWWLDSHRPPVLIFRGNHCETLIVSMPCSLDDYIWFPLDPKDWLVNKGQLDSRDIRFTKQKCIRFANTNHRPITLDLVYLIGRVFRAPKQELSIPHWEFVSPDLLIEQVSLFSHLFRSASYQN